MHKACLGYFNEIDIAVFAAAVADYRPQTVADRKIKKAGNELCIQLVKNPDIAFEFGRLKRNDQLSIGFALETNDELMNAESKLHCKNFDMVVLNSMNDAGAAFGYDTIKVTIIQEGMTPKEFPVKNKTDVAHDIIREIADVMQNQFAYKGGLV
jgi:phosphopantothenoylcysteine decarboxylase/phosphopantothenate--cysteine ligase